MPVGCAQTRKTSEAHLVFKARKFYIEAMKKTDLQFFFQLSFLSHDIHDSQNNNGRGRLYLILLYHSHPLQEHSHNSQMIIADSLPLHIVAGLEPGSSKQSLTTKLRALIYKFSVGEVKQWKSYNEFHILSWTPVYL